MVEEDTDRLTAAPNSKDGEVVGRSFVIRAHTLRQGWGVSGMGWVRGMGEGEMGEGG